MRTSTSRRSVVAVVACGLLCLTASGCKSGFSMPQNMFAWGKKTPPRDTLAGARRPSASQLPNPTATTTSQQLAGTGSRNGTNMTQASTGQSYYSNQGATAPTNYPPTSTPNFAAGQPATSQYQSTQPPTYSPQPPSGYNSVASRNTYVTQPTTAPTQASPANPYSDQYRRGGDAYSAPQQAPPAGTSPYAPTQGSTAPANYDPAPTGPYGGSSSWQSKTAPATTLGSTGSAGFTPPAGPYRPGSTSRDTGTLNGTTTAQAPGDTYLPPSASNPSNQSRGTLY